MRWAGFLLAIAALVPARRAEACSCAFIARILAPRSGAIAALVPARRAEACSCAFIARILAPRSGAVDVPLNAVIVVEGMGDGDSLSVTDPSGSAIALEDDADEPTRVARPAADLLPGTEYAAAVIGPDGVTRAESRFVTGGGRDDAPAVFAGIAGFVAETQEFPAPISPWSSGCISSCVDAVDGHISRIRFDHERPAEVTWYELALRREGEPIPLEVRRLPPDHDGLLGEFSCAPRSPPLAPEARYCARVTAFDAAGHPSGGEVELCADALTCEPRDEGCQPVAICRPITRDGSGGGGCGCVVAQRDAFPWPAPLLAALTLAASARPRRGPRSRP